MARRRTILLIWLAPLLFSVAMAETASPLRLLRSIELPKVEGRIDHMCLSDDGRCLFVAALGNNSVEIVDAEAGTYAGSIGNIKEPQGVAYIPRSGKLAVASGQGDECRIYDEHLALVGPVGGLDDADNVRFDPQAGLLYVGYGKGAIAVIDSENARRLADIRLEGHPESFQLEVKGKRIFANVPTAQQIAVIDREKRTVMATWPVRDAKANFPMALDEASHRLFIGCRQPAKLLVIDTESGKPVASLDCCGDSDDVFYDRARKRIYISGGAGSISVFEQSDPDRYSLLAMIPTAPGARTSLLASDGGRLFVAVPHRGAQKAAIRLFQAVPEIK
jgi:DNA-binding beta-propeller fold protein YncE